jgi:hypothetical protein
LDGPPSQCLDANTPPEELEVEAEMDEEGQAGALAAGAACEAAIAAALASQAAEAAAAGAAMVVMERQAYDEAQPQAGAGLSQGPAGWPRVAMARVSSVEWAVLGNDPVSQTDGWNYTERKLTGNADLLGGGAACVHFSAAGGRVFHDTLALVTGCKNGEQVHLELGAWAGADWVEKKTNDVRRRSGAGGNLQYSDREYEQGPAGLVCLRADTKKALLRWVGNAAAARDIHKEHRTLGVGNRSKEMAEFNFDYSKVARTPKEGRWHDTALGNLREFEAELVVVDVYVNGKVVCDSLMALLRHPAEQGDSQCALELEIAMHKMDAAAQKQAGHGLRRKQVRLSQREWVVARHLEALRVGNRKPAMKVWQARWLANMDEQLRQCTNSTEVHPGLPADFYSGVGITDA